MNLCIYHNKDADGWMCANIYADAMKKDNTRFIGWNYGDNLDLDKMGMFEEIYLMDLSPNLNIMLHILTHTHMLIWIDHHDTTTRIYKEIKDKHPTVSASIILKHRMDQSAAYIAWEYFNQEPVPWLIRMVSIRDSWQKNHELFEEAKTLDCGIIYDMNMYNRKPTTGYIDHHTENSLATNQLLSNSSILQVSKRNQYHSLVKSGFKGAYGFLMGEHDDGRKIIKPCNWFAINSQFVDPEIFEYLEELITKDFGAYNLGITFCIIDKHVRGTFYSTDPTINCALIAKEFNGGGHPGAAGFKAPLEEMKWLIKSF